MNINDLTLGQIKEIQSLTATESKHKKELASKWIGKTVLVRTCSAGVHFGTLSEIEGNDLILTNSQRIWNWGGAFTLSKVATEGPVSAKLSCIVGEINLEKIEIIPLTQTAIDKLSSLGVHNE